MINVEWNLILPIIALHRKRSRYIKTWAKGLIYVVGTLQKHWEVQLTQALEIK